MTQLKTSLVGLGLATAIAMMAIPIAAHAEGREGRDNWPRNREWRNREWGDHEWRGQESRGRDWRGPVVYAAPGPYYAPPPVYYAPPPVYYAPPPVYFGPPPGITIGLGLSLR